MPVWAGPAGPRRVAAAGWPAEVAALLHLKAKPGSRVNQLLIGSDGALTARLNAPAQEGKANAALQTYLASTFGIAKNRVTLLAGHT